MCSTNTGGQKNDVEIQAETQSQVIKHKKKKKENFLGSVKSRIIQQYSTGPGTIDQWNRQELRKRTKYV